MNYDCIKKIVNDITNYIVECRQDDDYINDSDSKLIKLFLKSNIIILPDNVKQLLATTTGKHFTVISVMSKYPANSYKTYALIDTLRTMQVGGHLTSDLTGTPVNNQELLSGIAQRLPVAMIWIMVFTYFILLLLLR